MIPTYGGSPKRKVIQNLVPGKVNHIKSDLHSAIQRVNSILSEKAWHLENLRMARSYIFQAHTCIVHVVRIRSQTGCCAVCFVDIPMKSVRGYEAIFLPVE